MPIVTIQLTGGPVTQQQKDALVSRSTDMIREILHQNPTITGVVIEEAASHPGKRARIPSPIVSGIRGSMRDV
jgi:4-oxalocrotonate tautomerase family enzyme